MDQFTTTSGHLGNLNDIHADLIISGLDTLFLLYPLISNKPVKVFFEANLSHDLAVSVKSKVVNYYIGHPIYPRKIAFVRQHDNQGKLLPGILTRHKANLVSYFKRVMDRDTVFVARQLVTVSRIIEQKYKYTMPCDSVCLGIGRVLPKISDMEHMLKVFVEQATMFRCYQKGGSVVYSGKKGTGKSAIVDDLVMAVILAVSWARLPQNSYILE